MRIPTIDCVTGQGGEYFEQLKSRSQLDMREERERVCEIIEAVRSRGDAALLEYEARFDRVELTCGTLEVTEAEIQEAYRQVGDEW
ncbi:MAG: histidinol dehydrogenase, partial [Christensenellaceae bacterium]